MTGFFVFAGIIAATVIMFRHWRKREMEAFLQTDLSVFEELNVAGHPEIAAPDRFNSAAIGANLVNVAGMPASVFQIKDKVFDDVHRSCLQALDGVIGDHYRLFIHVPISELVRSDEKKHKDELRGKTLSFLLCDRESLTVTCGIQLKGAGASEEDRHAFIEDVFRQIDKPLITLPMLTAYSPLELKESLADALNDAPSARLCPKCGRQMMMRKAVKGRNTGKNFWVCTEFPSCKGIMRIGRF